MSGFLSVFRNMFVFFLLTHAFAVVLSGSIFFARGPFYKFVAGFLEDYYPTMPYVNSMVIINMLNIAYYIWFYCVSVITYLIVEFYIAFRLNQKHHHHHGNIVHGNISGVSVSSCPSDDGVRCDVCDDNQCLDIGERISDLLNNTITQILDYEKKLSDALKEENRLRMEAYRKSRMLREVIDLIPMHIFAKDGSGRKFFMVNRAFADCWGKNPKEMIGLTDSDLIKQSDILAEIEKNDEHILATRTPCFNLTGKITCVATGKRMTMLTNKIMFETWTGDPAILGMSRDITKELILDKILETLGIEFAIDDDDWQLVTERMKVLAFTGFDYPQRIEDDDDSEESYAAYSDEMENVVCR